ncbi:hypothetical protein [Aestuariirhabdus sp. LZHN29]|uniref:hypothetical protein n=1 Tax=Aestuariirhabdus sp. LZHN29 TaxID=3417462 RepID=UPI003CF31078
MSKYLYTTVFEQFTGEKPPEPQTNNERKPRRTHGHPYRMRHNMRMQEQELQGEQCQTQTERHPGGTDNRSIADIADIESRRKPKAQPTIVFKKSRAIRNHSTFANEIAAHA